MGLTLGSLFDGSGGFPLAGLIYGIDPLWASEIEPYPIAVTRSRFPNMKHYGDVSAINGADVPPVDILTFGSPCQDMSVAGKRAGLEGSRSSLFHEAIRIIKEMRSATDGKYPKWAVWENVPGAFTSNGGGDFRCVLQEFVWIKDETAIVPRPARWQNAGEIVGDGFSVAWRVIDAQYWGVPQRRKRIYLVCDLTGGRAGKVLFESESLSRYSAESQKAWQNLANASADRAGASGECLVYDARGNGGGVSPTLTVDHQNRVTDYTAICVAQNWDGSQTSPTLTKNNVGGNQRMPDKDNFNCVLQPFGICAKDSNAMKSSNPHSGIYEADTSRTIDTSGGNPACNQGGIAIVSLEGNGARPSHRGCGYSEDDVSFTLNTTELHGVAYAVDCRNDRIQSVNGTIQAKPTGGQSLQTNQVVMEPHGFTMDAIGQYSDGDIGSTCKQIDYKDATDLVVEPYYVVRRLTPIECARMQGFPDRHGEIDHKDSFTPEEEEFWRDVYVTHQRIVNGKTNAKPPKDIIGWYNKLQTDSAEYKMWGNGIALPCAAFVLAGIEWAENMKEEYNNEPES